MSGEEPSGLAGEIRARAITLDTTDPAADSAELEPFVNATTNASVVGLGEATHRTSEFFRLKHRLIRSLVENHGVRLFALEASFSETVRLDEYVFRDAGSLDTALDTLGYSIHRTREMYDLFRWMRAFNNGRPADDRIAVYGFDVQSAAGAAAALIPLLEGHEGSLPDVGGSGQQFGVDTMLGALETLSEGVFSGADVNTDRLNLGEQVGRRLGQWFDEKCWTLDTDAGHHTDDGALAGRHIRTLQQACEFARRGIEEDTAAQYGLRDRLMAENIAWIHEHEGGQVAVWAHNNHIKRGGLSGRAAQSMGDHLDSRYGAGYYATCVQFGRGTVRPLVPADEEPDIEYNGRKLTRTDVSVPDLTPGSVPALFSRVGEPVVLLDYRSVPADSRLGVWLDRPQQHHYITGAVEPDDRSSFYATHRPLRDFDGLAFVSDVEPPTRLG